MRKANPEVQVREQDKYIHNLALQVMSHIGNVIDDFLEYADSPHAFAAYFSRDVHAWLIKNVTNPATLAKIISCGRSSIEIDSVYLGIRYTPVSAVMPPLEPEDMDKGGVVLMEHFATYTLCAAIYDACMFQLENRSLHYSARDHDYNR